MPNVPCGNAPVMARPSLTTMLSSNQDVLRDIFLMVNDLYVKVKGPEMCPADKPCLAGEGILFDVEMQGILLRETRDKLNEIMNAVF